MVIYFTMLKIKKLKINIFMITRQLFMCSNNIDIEDIVKNKRDNIHRLYPDTMDVDTDKMKAFMEDFVKLGRFAEQNKELQSITKKLRSQYRVHPSKLQMRIHFSKYHSGVEVGQRFKRFMIKKAMRSQSGVLVVTVTLSPNKFSCSKNCYYCPQETDLKGNHTQPRSYMSSEPAMRRALRHEFDIRGQFWDRIQSYIATGNIDVTDITSKKMEVILSGGTWECYPKDERDRFINECYWAANTYGKKDRPMLSIEEEELINETADYRIIGMTLETRPDFVTKYSIKDYRRYGVTRIQIGVQQYDDEILKKVNRGCYTKDTIKAIRLLKQVGLKVVVHLMPDLPGSSPDKDLQMFKRAIEDPDLQFDDIKIYPTAVCRSHDDNYILYSKIAEWYDNGEYTPYAEENIDNLINVIIYYFANVNPWVRVQRCIRDIPGCSIEAGYQKKSNLRQIINQKMEKNNLKTQEIRSMEVRESKYLRYPARLVVRKYFASEGIEYHISMEAYDEKVINTIYYYMFITFAAFYNLFTFGQKMYWSGSNDYVALFGFLRLRIDSDPGGNIIPEIKNTALIREVHVYGNALGVGSDKLSSQHRGYGQYLVKIAENIAIQHGYTMTSVIAGIGTKEYYDRKCGYHKKGTYMIRDLTNYRYNNLVIKISVFVFIIGFFLI